MTSPHENSGDALDSPSRTEVMRAEERRVHRAAFDSVAIDQMRRSARIKWSLYRGRDVIPAWVADMDLPIAPAIQRRVAELVEAGDLGYHALPMPAELRSTFIDHLDRSFGWRVDPRQVWALVNVVQGIDTAIHLFTRPGEGVVLMTPIYAPFHRAVDLTGRRRIDHELVASENGSFEIDFDRLDAQLGQTDGAEPARLLLLCHPHNPTGRVWSREELTRLAELVVAHDLVVVSDEIHAELVFPDEAAPGTSPRRHVPFANVSDEVAARTVTLTSATKAYNLAGLPFALAIFGSSELKAAMKTLPPHLLGHGGILGAEAARVAWSEARAWREDLVAYLDDRRRQVEAAVESLPGVGMRSPEGSYLAWLDCRELDLGPDPATFFLERAGVALSPGPDFGPPGEGHARLNFATSQSILTEILDRMRHAVVSR